jgi:S-DNA-T family DNA segregation ATPase FtsK/SpoIIIE
MARNRKISEANTDPRIQKRYLREIEIYGAGLTVFGAVLMLSLITSHKTDRDLSLGSPEVENFMGSVGAELAHEFMWLFGILSFVIAAAVIFIGVRAVLGKPYRATVARMSSPFTAMLCAAMLLQICLKGMTPFDYMPGGYTGGYTGEMLIELFSRSGAILVASIGLALSVFYISGFTLGQVFRFFGRQISKLFNKIKAKAGAAFRKPEPEFPSMPEGGCSGFNDAVSVISRNDVQDVASSANGPDTAITSPALTASKLPVSLTPETSCDPAWAGFDNEFEQSRLADAEISSVSQILTADVSSVIEAIEPEEDTFMAIIKTGENPYDMSGPRIVVNKREKASIQEDLLLPQVVQGPWEPPSLSLLDYVEPGKQEIDRDFLRRNAEKLEKKLLDYKVQGKVVEIHPGPVVTMYEFLPAAGVKISQIANLADDLTMALEAVSIRIVAPIPGKGVVGIEVPNKVRETVYLREILASEVFTRSKSKLTIALGKDIFGNPVVTDLARMPHLLIAGATGSGKSVAVNAFILSLLRNATPDEVRIILVDPKVVELQVYDNIPHLLLPVVFDPKHAAAALRWAVDEMERRYALLARFNTRNIGSFNQRVDKIQDIKAGRAVAEADDEFESAFTCNPEEFDEEDLKKLPFIVIVLDEFADLMMVASKDVETAVARLAQKARAAGIHLVMATQRPSKEVITGLIKANFPSRIAFRVSGKIDSRIILDQNGADALLGYGDMLFLRPGTSSLERVHGSFVSDEEVMRVVNHLKTQGSPDYQMEIIQGADEEPEDEDEDYDVLTEQAQDIVLESRRASISFLQRKLKIGYNRSARIMELLEKRRVVGPPDSRGERKVLL